MDQIFKEYENYIEIIDSESFDIVDILECGQIFRYKKTLNGFKIYAKDQEIEVSCQKDSIKIFAQNLDFVKNYFDLWLFNYTYGL